MALFIDYIKLHQGMKKIAKILIAIGIGLLIAGAILWDWDNPKHKPNQNPIVDTTKYTDVVLINKSELDSVKVFVTLQGTKSIVGLFGMDSSNIITYCIDSVPCVGSFWAKKGVEYHLGDTTPLSGVIITWGVQNQSCPAALQIWRRWEAVQSGGTETRQVRARDLTRSSIVIRTSQVKLGLSLHPLWREALQQLRLHLLPLLLRPLKQIGQRRSIRQSRARVSEFIKERVKQGLVGLGTLAGDIDQQRSYEVDRITRSLVLKEPWPGNCLDLRELELGVVGVHSEDLVSGRRAQHFDDLNQLVNCIVAREDRVAEDHFGYYAAVAPDVDHSVVFSRSEDEFWCSVVP